MITSENFSSPYLGNNTFNEMAYGFPVSDKTEVLVTETDIDGMNPVVRVVDVHYTVNGVGSDNNAIWIITRIGGNLPAGVKWTITPNIPFTQSTDFGNQGSFFAKTHERAFDRLTLISQWLKESVSRCVKINIGSNSNPDQIISDLQSSAIDAENASSSASASAAAALQSAMDAANYPLPAWVTGSGYVVGKVVYDPTTNVIARCTAPHTSGATFAGDVANWQLMGSAGGVNMDDVWSYSGI